MENQEYVYHCSDCKGIWIECHCPGSIGYLPAFQ